jgi:hypothetical protein
MCNHNSLSNNVFCGGRTWLFPSCRMDLVCEYSALEACTYCAAPVPFESPDDVPAERHMLSRCRASMRLCSVLQPVWHCVCCGGMVDKLLPESFFTMPACPLDADPLICRYRPSHFAPSAAFCCRGRCRSFSCPYRRYRLVLLGWQPHV